MKSISDQNDLIIYNYFDRGLNKIEFNNLIIDRTASTESLKMRYLWLKEQEIDPNIIHLDENHKLVSLIFDMCNKMFKENGIEHYYTSGILSYYLAGKELERYHHDLDVFVNMDNLEKLENVCEQYGFIFKRVYGDRGNNTKRVMLKLYYRNAIEIPITIFMYVRKQDNSIEQNDYFISESGEKYVEKIYSSSKVAKLSFSNVVHTHNGTEYFSITAEALYLCKDGNRKKDIYDCKQFKHIVDFDKLEELKKRLEVNKNNYTYLAENDQYYSFIFNKDIVEKVLLR